MYLSIPILIYSAVIGALRWTRPWCCARLCALWLAACVRTSLWCIGLLETLEATKTATLQAKNRVRCGRTRCFASSHYLPGWLQSLSSFGSFWSLFDDSLYQTGRPRQTKNHWAFGSLSVWFVDFVRKLVFESKFSWNFLQPLLSQDVLLASSQITKQQALHNRVVSTADCVNKREPPPPCAFHTVSCSPRGLQNDLSTKSGKI